MATTLHRAAACALALCAVRAQAQEGEAPVHQLSGTLQRIKATGVVRLGHRVNSIPFAFLDERGKPVGYSLDLCRAVVEEAAQELGGVELRVETRPVTPENRFALVASGEVDLECGSTTSNVERRKQVAFSPIIFVSGTKLLVRKGAGIRSLRDLRGKTVVVTRGTTNAAAAQAIARKQGLGISFVSGADHGESFQILESGKADAFANDDVLLYGLVAETRTRARYRVVGDFLSYDPYALVFRKDDPDFAAVVDRAFERLARSREIVAIYAKWFLKPLPSGVRLDLPMSPHLEEALRVLGLPGEGS